MTLLVSCGTIQLASDRGAKHSLHRAGLISLARGGANSCTNYRAEIRIYFVEGTAVIWINGVVAIQEYPGFALSLASKLTFTGKMNYIGSFLKNHPNRAIQGQAGFSQVEIEGGHSASHTPPNHALQYASALKKRGTPPVIDSSQIQAMIGPLGYAFDGP